MIEGTGGKIPRRAALYTASGLPLLEWRGARWVLSRVRLPRCCASCGALVGPGDYAYRGPAGRVVCEPCARPYREGSSG